MPPELTNDQYTIILVVLSSIFISCLIATWIYRNDPEIISYNSTLEMFKAEKERRKKEEKNRVKEWTSRMERSVNSFIWG